MLHFHIISIFPGPIDTYLNESILKRAQANKYIQVSYYNPMDHLEPSKHGSLPRRIDDKPYGGGPGMVMRAEPYIRAIKAAIGRKRNYHIIHFAPRSQKFTNKEARAYASDARKPKSPIKDIVIICGRYEGIDSRVNEIYAGKTYSMGDYVLTGGEIPAMIIVDSITRQIPGVLGDLASIEEERVAAGKYYTRPEVITVSKKKYVVPEVLLEGNHKKIEEWKRKN